MERWIPVDIDLYRKPKFVALCRAMQATKYEAAGRVLAVWFWVQSYGPTTALDASGVDEATGTPPGTAEALIASGWATANRRSGTIRFHWPGETLAEIRERRSEAGRRAVRARWDRVRSEQAAGYDGDTTVLRPNYKTESKSKTKSKTKRLEPDGSSLVPVDAETSSTGTSDDPKRSRSLPIDWNPEAGFGGVTDADRRAWAAAYPAVDVDAELARAHAWLAAEPPSGRWRNVRAGLRRWMARSQNYADRRSGGPQLTKQTNRGTLPFGCYFDADGIARTASGARLDRPGDDR